MKHIILITLVSIITINVFGQSEGSKTQFKNEITITGGKFYSPYKYFQYYDAFENINLSYSHIISGKIGALFTQGYGRMFDKNTNSRAFVISSNISVFANVLQIKDINFRVSLGTGLEQIHIKCLYDFYPVDRHFYGIPIHLETSFEYNFSKKFFIIINARSNYSFLFSNKNSLFVDSSYYRTWFFSTNIGIGYAFN
jgi:hypothetical protein